MNKFKIGFWHPFGIAARESRDCIISRKKEEIKKNGWTLWSFRNGLEKTIKEKINLWVKKIGKDNENVFILCSDSPNARDPKGDVSSAKHFKFANSDKWKKIPPLIEVPHPFGKKDNAFVFIVKDIYKPDKINIPKRIKWLRKNGKWEEDKLSKGTEYPTRGEYLIKSGGKCELRKVYQILELKHPYLAILKK